MIIGLMEIFVESGGASIGVVPDELLGLEEIFVLRCRDRLDFIGALSGFQLPVALHVKSLSI